MNIEVVLSMLATRGISADIALNGNQALSQIEQRIELNYRDEASMYQIVLLDYSMPEMDGP